MGLHHVLPVSLAKVFTSDSIFVNPGLDTVRFRFSYSLKPFKISAPVLHRSLQAKECIILFVSVSLKRFPFFAPIVIGSDYIKSFEYIYCHMSNQLPDVSQSYCASLVSSRVRFIYLSKLSPILV